MSRSTLPLARELEQGVVLTKRDAALNRHLAAAGLYDTVEIRVSLQHDLRTPEDPEGFADLVEMRRTKGFGSTGKVICPECDGSGTQDDGDDDDTDDGPPCEVCSGDAMITPAEWDAWFEENVGCLTYVRGCEKACERPTCPHDERRCAVDVPILLLESRKLAGSWKVRGDSFEGFEIDKGIALNPAALHRFLSLVAVAAGFGLMDDL